MGNRGARIWDTGKKPLENTEGGYRERRRVDLERGATMRRESKKKIQALLRGT